ncbi:hypothetical protein GQ607_007189 [Colletotrichum asianum]|uniref:Uncharacterized protein n=1 Tax=Colletotrichum asianum TaxID=702518 RepID=A0A8H3WCF7_9PEZI|nr:hypothetical protein GQ607_007189 [Colletotrichum asianum]
MDNPSSPKTQTAVTVALIISMFFVSLSVCPWLSPPLFSLFRHTRLTNHQSRFINTRPDQPSPVQSSPLLSSHIHAYQQTRMPLAAALMQVKSAVIFLLPKSTGGVQRPGQHSRALQPCRPSRPTPIPVIRIVVNFLNGPRLLCT